MRRFVLLLVVLTVPSAARAQTAVVEFDHATSAVRLIVSHGTRVDTTLLGKNPVVRLPRSVPVDVRVVNTNTAFYRFSKESEASPLPEMESVRSFMGRLGPYFPDLRASLGRTRSRGAEEIDVVALNTSRRLLLEGMANVRAAMVRLDVALYGPQGLNENLTTSLLALEQMRRGVPPEQASEPLRQSLGLGAPCGTGAPVRLATSQQLLTAVFDLAHSSQNVIAALGGPEFESDAAWRALRDSADQFNQRAQKALTDFEPLVATAYRVERLVGIVAGACSQWSAGAIAGTLTSGRTLEIRVEPRTEPELARLGDHQARTFRVGVQPRFIVRPGVAVGIVAAPHARFAKYGTRPASGGFEIVETGRTDARFSPGGMLGLTWPGLDQREQRGFAVWLPELTVTAGGVPAFGVGAAISWRFLKVGAGALWVRHLALDGVRSGAIVSDPSGLRLSDSYGSPTLYLSMSVFDWSPLADRLGRRSQ